MRVANLLATAANSIYHAQTIHWDKITRQICVRLWHGRRAAWKTKSLEL